MKIKLIVISVFIMVCIGAVTYDMWQQPTLTTYKETITERTYLPLPVVKVENLLNDKIINLDSLNEDTILIHFWASWCTICLAEMGDLLELINSKNGGISLIAISIDDDKKSALKAYEYFKNNNPNNIKNSHIYWAWDKDKKISLKTFNILKTPETIVVNKDRLMVNKIIGAYDWETFSP